MTSDAKVGLLLGLAFIFIIAFIINGLPSFKHQPDSNELTRNMAKPHRNPPGIGTTARMVNREVIERIEPVCQPPLTNQTSTQSVPEPMEHTVRYQTQLPEISASELRPAAEQVLKSVNESGQTKEDAVQPREKELPRPVIYTVKDGDSLADIAKSIYGQEEGNRRINIDRIYQANRKVLRSPDLLYVGQKLTVPPLTESADEVRNPAEVLSGDKFESVESIGKRNSLKSAKSEDSGRYYVVKDGDHLWKIACEQLGNGNRYTEISKLNKKILSDEDRLVVGMRLKMPSR